MLIRSWSSYTYILPLFSFPQLGNNMNFKKTAEQFPQRQFNLKARWLNVKESESRFKPLSNWGDKCQGEVTFIQQSEEGKYIPCKLSFKLQVNPIYSIVIADQSILNSFEDLKWILWGKQHQMQRGLSLPLFPGLSDKPQRFLSPEKPRDFPLGPENNKNHQGRPHNYKSPFLSNDGLGLNNASVTF